MKTIGELDTLEKIAFETGLRHDALQAEFERRKSLPEPRPNHAKKFLEYLQWLYKAKSDPNLPTFEVWAEGILGMPVIGYLHS